MYLSDPLHSQPAIAPSISEITTAEVSMRARYSSVSLAWLGRLLNGEDADLCGDVGGIEGVRVWWAAAVGSGGADIVDGVTGSVVIGADFVRAVVLGLGKSDFSTDGSAIRTSSCLFDIIDGVVGATLGRTTLAADDGVDLVRDAGLDCAGGLRWRRGSTESPNKFVTEFDVSIGVDPSLSDLLDCFQWIRGA